MKIRVEIDNEAEEEILIRCHELTPRIAAIQKALSDAVEKKPSFVFYKGDMEYYFPLENVLFFETDDNGICAHTKTEVYNVKYKLYELEEMLPRYFVRVSKSTILNVNKIFSMDHNLASYSTVQFQNTHKQVYVSRRYYKTVKLCLEERR